MNLKNLKYFEDELYIDLENLKIDNISECVTYIIRLIKSCESSRNFESILKKKLDCKFGEKSDEIIDIICNYFNVKRTYGLYDDHSGNESNQTISDGENGSGNLLENHGKTKCNFAKRVQGIQLKAMYKPKIKWTDIARSVKSTNLSRRMKIPCTTFREKGFCMNGDTCKFTHGRAALVKPRLVTMNSIYEEITTEGEGIHRVDYSNYILPEQGDEGEAPCRKREHRCPEENTINLSSDESDAPFVPYSPPKIYTPPTILDSPLWYKELGLVVEETDTDSSSAHKKKKWKNCLVISNIPPSMNRIGIINKHFRKFGVLRNIEVKYQGDPERALVEFRLARDMLKANKSVEAVMGNRFIKTRAYKKKRLKTESSQKHKTKNRCRSKERSCIRYSQSPSRDNHGQNKKKSKTRNSYNKSRDSRSKSKDGRSRRRYSRNQSRDSGSRNRHSRSRSRDSQNRRRNSRSQTRDSRSFVECNGNRIIITESYYHRRSKEKRFKKKRKSRDISRESDDCIIYSKESGSSSRITINNSKQINESSEMAKETPESRRVVIKQECSSLPLGQTPLDLVVSIREEMQVDSTISVANTAVMETVTGLPIASNISQDDVSDVKLERALNDSDVDSVDSDDSLGRRKRDLEIEKRRLQLRVENQKNSATAKLKRVSDSLKHYKTILEALIIEFKKSDKIKKSILIPQIKENHARFMQLKELHSKINVSHEIIKKRNQDPVEGQINELQTNIVDQLNVTQGETDLSGSKSIYIHVPIDVVLYQEQLQAIVGSDLEIVNFEMSGYSSSSILYIITLGSHLSTCQALKMLTLSQESANWKVSMSFSEPM